MTPPYGKKLNKISRPGLVTGLLFLYNERKNKRYSYETL